MKFTIDVLGIFLKVVVKVSERNVTKVNYELTLKHPLYKLLCH